MRISLQKRERSSVNPTIRKLSTIRKLQVDKKKILDDIAKQLNIVEMKDWYKVTKKDVAKLYKMKSKEKLNSMYSVLSSVYSEHEWLPWMFQNESLSNEYWKEKTNREKYFKWLGKELNYQVPSDWCKLTSELLKKHGGWRLLGTYYHGSIVTALKDIFPQHNWTTWQVSSVSHGYWKDEVNGKNYFNWLGNKLGYKEMDDWYKITQSQILKYSGLWILSTYYNGSTVQAIQKVFPEHNWIPWKFKTVPHGFWENPVNRKNYFIWLGDELGYKELNDWYNITVTKINEYGGSGVIQRYYNTSPYQALKEVFPEHNWIPWKFKTVPNGFWEDEMNRKNYFLWLGSELGFKEMSDWYKITQNQIFELGGCGVLNNYYNGSPSLALKEVFPEYTWNPWKFKYVPNGYWEDQVNRKNYFLWLKQNKDLGDIIEEIPYNIIQLEGGLPNIISTYFPELKKQNLKKLTQHKLATFIKHSFHVEAKEKTGNTG